MGVGTDILLPASGQTFSDVPVTLERRKQMGRAVGHPQNAGRRVGISHPPQGRETKVMGIEESHPPLLLHCLLN